MRFISFINILLIFVIFSCNSHEKKESTEPIINEAILEGLLRRPDHPPKSFETTKLGVIQITGVLHEGTEGTEGGACYIVSENDTWYILSKEDNFNYPYGIKITIEGEGTIFDRRYHASFRPRKHQELRNVKLIEVHNRMDI